MPHGLNQQLPTFVAPMLARRGEPFDSDRHLFEIKWDGTRTLAFIEAGGYRLVNRREADMTDRYPELAFLARLPPGTVLDGETVVLRHGKPDFQQLQVREQSRSARRIQALARTLPATYIVFDQLYARYASCMDRPLEERRAGLLELVHTTSELVFSDGITGHGKQFFEEACRQGLEGVMAKRLGSRYLPGKRSDAWIKIKRGDKLLCAIIGFLPAGADDFRSLILAAPEEGELHCVGKVGSGFTDAVRNRLAGLLWSRLCPRPLIACKIRGKWVEPGLYCTVRFQERTPGGELRAPVFEALHAE